MQLPCIEFLKFDEALTLLEQVDDDTSDTSAEDVFDELADSEQDTSADSETVVEDETTEVTDPTVIQESLMDPGNIQATLTIVIVS